MKAFFVGLLFLISVGLLIVLGTLLFPFISILTVLAAAVLIVVLLIFAIWLLGKVILYLWGKIKK